MLRGSSKSLIYDVSVKYKNNTDIVNGTNTFIVLVQVLYSCIIQCRGMVFNKCSICSR